ncbi:MAG: alkaline phosphatase family protein [Thermoplasmata archaeon]|nr:alkaline phosphatase family protein [Thermoplasmata archaeon]
MRRERGAVRSLDLACGVGVQRSLRSPLVFATMLLLVVSSSLPAWWTASQSPTPVEPRTAVRHVVEIMMENHAFDNFFGTFPGASGLPPNTSLPDGMGGRVRPYWIPGNATPDLPHDLGSELVDLDHGAMDGFVEAMARFNASIPDTPMGYYNDSQIGGYWTLASQFVLCDRYFAPVLGPSNPNRLYAIAGDSGGVTSDAWPAGGVRIQTLFDELSLYGVSWRYYYQPSTFLPIPLHVAPLSFSPTETAKIVPLAGLVADIQAGALPAVTFVDPSATQYSGHPPQDVRWSVNWSLSIIGAIELSPLWASTAIFLTWDEGGGFYDHVRPPSIDALGDGFRVPMLVISPFTAHGGIVSTVFDHTSVLKFVDENWGLPYLNSRVAGANSIGSVLRPGAAAASTSGSTGNPAMGLQGPQAAWAPRSWPDVGDGGSRRARVPPRTLRWPRRRRSSNLPGSTGRVRLPGPAERVRSTCRSGARNFRALQK